MAVRVALEVPWNPCQPGGLEHVDTSSGVLGSAVNKAIATLVPVIAKADVESKLRRRRLERPWHVLQEDGRGELGATPEPALHWADEFMPLVESVWNLDASGHGVFEGSRARLSALFTPGRCEEPLAPIDTAPFKSRHDRRLGLNALAAMGKGGGDSLRRGIRRSRCSLGGDLRGRRRGVSVQRVNEQNVWTWPRRSVPKTNRSPSS